MSPTICLGSEMFDYPEGGGLLWQYLNWALGLRQIGCRVIWLENVGALGPPERVRSLTKALKERLAPYGLEDAVALSSWNGSPLPVEMTEGCLDLDAAAVEADLLLNFHTGMDDVNARFRRSALLDTDPGVRQVCVNAGRFKLARHD